MNRARSSLRRAQVPLEGVYLEDLCFDAQQAAEKALKVVLISRRTLFPYVHDLGQLLEIIEQKGVVVPQLVSGATRLTDYAVTTRDPELSEPVTPEEHASAVALADAVVQWAGEIIEQATHATEAEAVDDS